ncbi:hypothetical protein [uncultured Streptomyces sp.]|uniref:proline-rich domain-containing protein n=1 Tax=uncultured Streptomyces sp. TaxID=174707 RepID=UPI00262B9126|nr:hypothetical protein [uncultured Streptomyces sp.]
MTTPPQPPQGPYGPPQPSQPPQNPYATAPQVPPQAPGPYGVPPQPGYGHPQQPPAPAQGGWGQQDGWGQQPPAAGAPGWPPQPPRKKRTGLVVGIVGAALLVVGGIVFGVVQLVDKGAETIYPAAEYELVVQKKLLDDEFTLSQDASETEGKEIENTPDLSIRDADAAIAQYTADGGAVLVVSGMDGRIASPGLTRDQIMTGAAKSDGATVVVPAKEYTPDGYDITVSCQVVSTGSGVADGNFPMCAWGDDNTAAMVAVVRPEDAVKEAKAIDLDKAAAEAAQVREEMRKPIG